MKYLTYVIPGLVGVAGGAGFIYGAIDGETAGILLGVALAPIGMKAFGPQILDVLRKFRKKPAEDKKPEIDG